MFQGVGYEPKHMVVAKLIDHVLAVALALDQSLGAQNSQALRNGRDFVSARLGQFAYTTGPIGQLFKDPKPIKVGQSSEEIGRLPNRAVGILRKVRGSGVLPLTEIVAHLGVDQFDRPVIIAVIAVGEMKMPVHQIADVVSVRYRLVSATGSVNVARFVSTAIVRGSALCRVCFVNLKLVLVYGLSVHVVKTPVMQIVHVPVMSDAGMPAVRSVNVVVVFVCVMIHSFYLLLFEHLFICSSEVFHKSATLNT